MEDNLKVTTIRLSDLQIKRLTLLADERQWSLSHFIRYLVDRHCETIFDKDSLEYRKEV